MIQVLSHALKVEIKGLMKHTLSCRFPGHICWSLRNDGFSGVSLISTLQPIFGTLKNVLKYLLFVWLTKIQNYVDMLVLILELAWVRFCNLEFYVVECDKGVWSLNRMTRHSIHWRLRRTCLSQRRSIWKNLRLPIVIKWDFSVLCQDRIIYAILKVDIWSSQIAGFIEQRTPCLLFIDVDSWLGSLGANCRQWIFSIGRKTIVKISWLDLCEKMFVF